jgi:hypothetical protein
VGGVFFGILAITGGRGKIAALVGAVLLFLLAWRLWMAGIRVGSDGVKVVTVFLSRRVSWDEVDRFAVLPLGRFPYVGYVVLRDGRKFGTFGLSTSSRQTEANRLRVQRSVDDLNQVLAERREAAGQPG